MKKSKRNENEAKKSGKKRKKAKKSEKKCEKMRKITKKTPLPTPSSSLGRYVFGSEISYNKAPPRLPGLAY